MEHTFHAYKNVGRKIEVSLMILVIYLDRHAALLGMGVISLLSATNVLSPVAHSSVVK